MGKGISLSDPECDKVVDSLAKRGYGTTEVLEDEIKRRRKMYGFSEEGSGE
jgi:DNA-binding PadR family transcriptional regulator